VSANRPHSPADAVAALRRICRKAGIKVTQQRLEVYLELATTEDHPTIEQLHARIRRRMPSISLDTVYRTIAAFERFGVIQRVRLADGRSRYDANLDVHHHFICTRCHVVRDFYWPAFDSARAPAEVQRLGDVRSKHVEARGLCQECQKKTRKRWGRRRRR
jgi:Fur family peroxide stress response transcriptional regulator